MTEGTRKTVDKSDLREAYAGPAVAANRFYVTMGPTLRIAFCEQLSDKVKPQFRSAVSLAHADAIVLANLLQKALAPVEKQMAEARAARDAAILAAPVAGSG
jgi:hypothetical protein